MSIYSMTGFGSSSSSENGLVASIEIKSVNHRGRKLNVHARPPLGVLEKSVRDKVTAKLTRGAIDVFISYRRESSGEVSSVQLEAADNIVSTLRVIADKLDLDGTINVSDLLSVPSLFEDDRYATIDESEWPAIGKSLDEAVMQLLEMRKVEGGKTAESLLALIKPINDFAISVREYAPKVIERVKLRLEDRIAELRRGVKVDADSQAIEREICIFSDRADINEELDRLDSHVAQFKSAIEKGGEVGKRLEFLAQEMLREVNTCASKANDTTIVTAAVDAKLAVEKIKEQAANLE